MKRVLVFFLCLSLLVPFLAAPALAAEAKLEEYVFTLLPETSFLSLDFDVFDDAGDELVFYCEDIISSGVYDFYVSSSSSVLFEDIVVNFIFDDVEQLWFSVCPSVTAYVVDGDSTFLLGNYDIVCFTDSDGTYLIVNADFSSSFIENVSSCVLMPVLSDNSSLLDVITPEMVSGVLDNVVTLIPAVVGGLAIFVGIRKGLAWLDNLIRGV